MIIAGKKEIKWGDVTRETGGGRVGVGATLDRMDGVTDVWAGPKGSQGARQLGEEKPRPWNE